MHKSIPIIFAILALFIFSLCSACVSQPPENQTPGPNAGLTQITLPVDSSRISFGEAQQNLREYGSGSMNETDDGKTVYYMLSRDLDESGKATSWIFGITSKSGAEFLVYDKTGFISIPWNATIASEKINMDTIVSPDSLFIQNKAVISSSPSTTIPERMDLELQRGIYTLTITSGSSTRSLTFNATTGALITKQ
jgi:hypothetical protein